MSKKDILVTVGLSAYNRPSTLPRAIESLLNQSYSNLEILISNDCSPDSKVDEIISSYAEKDPRIVYLNQKINIGETENNSLMLEIASGDFFMWLADDDYISEDYILEIMKEFEIDDSYSLIGGQSFFVNTAKGLQIEKEPYDLLDEIPQERFLKYLEMVDSNSIFYGIFRTKNSIDYNFHFYGSDWLHVARLAWKGKVKTLNNVYVYREDSGMSTGNFTYVERVKIYYNIYKEFKFDLMHSSLYSKLSKAELNDVMKVSKKSILKHLFISNIFVIIKNKIFKRI